MNLDASDYYELVKELSFSMVGIVFWGISCAFIALAVSLTLMLIFRKTILVKRRHVILRVISIAHFVIVPLLAAFFGFKWGMADGIEEGLKKAMFKYTKEMNQGFNAVIRSSANAIMGEAALNNKTLSGNEFIEKLSDRIFDDYGAAVKTAGEEKGVKGKMIGLVFKVTKATGTYVVKKGIRKLLEKTIKTDHDFTKEMMDKKMNEVTGAGILQNIIETQIEHIFGGMKKSVITLFCIILLIPATEVVIAYFLHKKKEKEALAAP